MVLWGFKTENVPPGILTDTIRQQSKTGPLEGKRETGNGTARDFTTAQLDSTLLTLFWFSLPNAVDSTFIGITSVMVPRELS